MSNVVIKSILHKKILNILQSTIVTYRIERIAEFLKYFTVILICRNIKESNSYE